MNIFLLLIYVLVSKFDILFQLYSNYIKKRGILKPLIVGFILLYICPIDFKVVPIFIVLV